MSNFICPCGETRAQQLLTSHLCANPTCFSYDENFARETSPAPEPATKSESSDEALITPVNGGSYTTGDFSVTYTTGSSTELTFWVDDGKYDMTEISYPSPSHDGKIDELEERVSSLEETVKLMQKAITQLQQNAISQLKTKLAQANKCACDDSGPCKAHGEKKEDPFDEAMEAYLKRSLQIGMIKELTYDKNYDKDGTVTDELF